MKKNEKKSIKLSVRFDCINEIIYYSILIILFGSAYLFTSNLLRFNWYSVIFASLTLILIYLKRASYLIVENGQLRVVYCHSYLIVALSMDEVEHFIFYEEKRLVKIKTKSGDSFAVYLTEKNKEYLLNWLIKYYPKILPIYIEND